jgi:hypothetical protein
LKSVFYSFDYGKSIVKYRMTLSLTPLFGNCQIRHKGLSFVSTLHNDDGTLNLFTDEAWFYANPHLYAESFLHPGKLGNCTIFEKSTSINFPISTPTSEFEYFT